MTVPMTRPTFETFGDILDHIGNVPPHRVRLTPKPGRATEEDVIRIQDHTKRNYELIDGVLVEKAVGSPESFLTVDLLFFLRSFLEDHPLGFLAGPDGIMLLWPGRIRMPDISFIAWHQVHGRKRPTTPITVLSPALAVEVLSADNTPAEMKLKRREYFLAGTKLVWMVDPARRIVKVYTDPGHFVTLTEEQTLEGGDVLPGFALPLRKLFAGVPEAETRPAKKRPGPKGPRKK